LVTGRDDDRLLGGRRRLWPKGRLWPGQPVRRRRRHGRVQADKARRGLAVLAPVHAERLVAPLQRLEHYDGRPNGLPSASDRTRHRRGEHAPVR
jgi:hypothetical protein